MNIKNVELINNGSNINKVFHYTSPYGLYCILLNKTLRFTDCQFFNDKSEYIHITKSLQQVVTSMKVRNKHLIESIQLWLNEDYEIKTNNLDRYRYYVFCTSTESDSLNMWNYYVKDGAYQGYNIGFSIDKMIKYFAQTALYSAEIWHGPVLYSDCEKVKVIKDLIQGVDINLSLIKGEVGSQEYWYTYLQESQTEIIDSIELFRLFFKDSAFKDEHEYRFVLKLPVKQNDSRYLSNGYEVKNGIFSPYCDFKIDDEIIDDITLSPMLDVKLASKGLQLYLENNDYQGINIISSTIPIRY